MTADFTTNATRIKQIEQQTPDNEYFTLEATVTQLWDSDADSIRQVGVLRDPTGIIKFISWENSDTQKVEEDETYLFENISVNYPESNDDDPEIVFRSKTAVTHQYADTRESFLQSFTPEEQNRKVNHDKWPVQLDDIVTETPYTVQVFEDGINETLDNSAVPWSTDFIEYCQSEFDAQTMTRTRISEYTPTSVTIQRKYITPHTAHKASTEFIHKYREFIDSKYFEKEATGMYTSRTLARVGECTMCDATFDVTPHLGYDPVAESDGNYVNWWYGGHGMETNEDFARLDCPECGAEAEWYEEHQYGSGVVRPPAVSNYVVFEFTVEFDEAETMEELVSKVESALNVEFTVQYSTYSVLSMKCHALNKHFDSEFFEIEQSGDPDSRGLTRQYIQCSSRGVMLKDEMERLNNILTLESEELIRVEEFQSHQDLHSTTKANSYYYPVDSESF